MEINITKLTGPDMFNFSHSVAEGGQHAGMNTWTSALIEDCNLLSTEEALQAMRDFAKESGGWSEEEIEEWSDEELNALFLQWIAGDCRELGADCLEDIDWEEAEEIQESGQASSNLFKGDDGEIYFSLY